jgi:Putative metallopeptidase
MRWILCLLALTLALPAQAQDELTVEQAYAQNIFVSVFYHELGHALIDIVQLPVLGLEEDAADVMSVVLINRTWEADAAEEKARAAAEFWTANAEYWASEGIEETYWGVHSPDARRVSTYVCLFYGADPEARGDFAADMGLPDDRAESCPTEFELADASWGVYLQEAEDAGPGQSFVFDGDAEADGYSALLASEIAWFNERMSLPEALTITIAECGESNAFYDPETKSITMCTELIDDLERLATTGVL